MCARIVSIGAGYTERTSEDVPAFLSVRASAMIFSETTVRVSRSPYP